MTTQSETQAMCERLKEVICKGSLGQVGVDTIKSASALLTRQQEEIEARDKLIGEIKAAFVVNGLRAGHSRDEIDAALAALQAKPDTSACDSQDPSEMCLHCHCWKFTRSTCK